MTDTTTAAADVAAMGTADHPRVIPPDPTTRRKRTTRAINRRRRRLPSSPPREALPDLNFPACDDERPKEGMRFVLQKELRNSDVSTGKNCSSKEAEANLPVLTAKDGFMLPMVDIITGQEWIFKYRFWPNNKSRMYVLENVGEFTKAHDLHHGDYVLVFKDETNNKYVICAKKKTLHQVPVSAAAAAATIEDGIFDSIVPDIVVASVNYSDLYCPLYDGMGMPCGLSSAFSPDLPVNFIDENITSSSAAAAAEPFKPNGAIEDLFLRDFP